LVVLGAAIAAVTASASSNPSGFYVDPGHRTGCLLNPRTAWCRNGPKVPGGPSTFVKINLAGVATRGPCSDCFLPWRKIPGLPVLRYGRTVKLDGFRLTSEHAGMLLTNRTGRGFLLTPAGHLIKEG